VCICAVKSSFSKKFKKVVVLIATKQEVEDFNGGGESELE
jgi:hypothetical protein